MEQIRILGAGISGLTAAISLAKAGHDVKVFEKNSDVGKSHKLDFEGLENWTSDIMKTIKSCGVKTKFKNKPFYRATWYSPSFRSAEIRSKEPFFYLVERGGKDSIEYSLKKQAQDCGVEFEFNSKKTAEDCGIISVGARKSDAFAFGSFFEDVKHEDAAMAVLSDKISPSLYFYVLVWNGRASVVSLSRKMCFDMQAVHKKNLGMNIVQDITKGSKKKHDFAGFVNFNIPKSATQNRKIMTGEAAGFQDAFLGFGMKYAFLSGYFAAKSIIENVSYDELWKESFLNELKKSQCSRLAIDLFGDRLYEKIISYLQENPECGRMLKNIYCKYDWKYKMLYNISRLRYR